MRDRRGLPEADRAPRPARCRQRASSRTRSRRSRPRSPSGYGIECDVRPSAAARPWSSTIVARSGSSTAEGRARRARGRRAETLHVSRRRRRRMIELAELLELVGGREPLLDRDQERVGRARSALPAGDSRRRRPPIAGRSGSCRSIPPSSSPSRALAPASPAASCRDCSRATAGGATSSERSAPSA